MRPLTKWLKTQIFRRDISGALLILVGFRLPWLRRAAVLLTGFNIQSLVHTHDYYYAVSPLVLQSTAWIPIPAYVIVLSVLLNWSSLVFVSELLTGLFVTTLLTYIGISSQVHHVYYEPRLGILVTYVGGVYLIACSVMRAIKKRRQHDP